MFPDNPGIVGAWESAWRRSKTFPGIVELADQKRQEYAPHATSFHRPSPDAAAVHEPWLLRLVENEGHVALVHEGDTGRVDGFLIASLFEAPPVYDPGGESCLVDDFMVEAPQLWPSVGRQLLEAAIDATRERDAVQTVVVCGPQDMAKRAMLLDMGHVVASEWLTMPFDEKR